MTLDSAETMPLDWGSDEQRSVEETLDALAKKLGGTPSVERYAVRREVGRGGMGVVLEAWDESLRRRLAMKVSRQEGTGSSRTRADPAATRSLGRFVAEAQITGQLDHPGIVPVHELGLDREGRFFFTMRLVKGHDLREILERVRKGEEGWSVPRALGVLLKVCEAMAYAHSKSVVHRDLKPANVMVGRFGEVYVMDWGLARVLDRPDPHDVRLKVSGELLSRSVIETEREAGGDDVVCTMDGDVVGTPAYMAPEQAAGRIDEVDARCDVYAVGAMLYQLLAGQAPFVPPGARVSARTVLARVLEGPPRPVHELAPQTPAELEAICDKAMARDRAKRYADIQEVAEDLRAYLENRVVRAYSTGAVAELKKWVRRNRPLATAIAAAVLVALAGLGTVTWVEREGRKIADEERNKAERSEERALRERANVLRLSAFQELEDLENEAEKLWPAAPARVPDYDLWLEKAARLVAGLESGPAELGGGHLATLAALRERAKSTSRGDGSEELVFASDEDRWWHNQLTRLVAAIQAFADERSGAIRGISPRFGPGIGRRRGIALTIEERTVSGREAAALWSEAIASIRDEQQCPTYEGLELRPQLGLLPIGRDRDSGLWEFAHVLTGDVPERDPDGRLEIGPETAVVLVLIPGGTFEMGAQSQTPMRANYDPWAEGSEAPVHTVTLPPYFLSKTEMTQGQWVRVTGVNPSFQQVYNPAAAAGGALRGTSPVERVSWDDCTRVLGWVGLALPTEPQWEYAARAGTDTPWWAGERVADLAGAANVLDADSVGHVEATRSPDLDLHDGFVGLAPVARLAPNAFGLHDVIGNVHEWCADTVYSYDTSLPSPTPVATFPSEKIKRLFRGGCYGEPALIARSARRMSYTPDLRSNWIGARPARAIEP
jgi:formylglycine-generating enzyme required for sulfatase activity/serine/threonine protein kinase